MKRTNTKVLLLALLAIAISSMASAGTYFNITMNATGSNTSVIFNVSATCDAFNIESNNITLTNCTIGSNFYTTLFFNQANTVNYTSTLGTGPKILINGTTAGIITYAYNNTFDTSGSGSGFAAESTFRGDFDRVSSGGPVSTQYRLRVRATSVGASLSAYENITNASLVSNITFLLNASTGPPMASIGIGSPGLSSTAFVYITLNDGNLVCGNETTSAIYSTYSLNSLDLYDIQINNTGDRRVHILRNGVELNSAATCYASSNIGNATQFQITGTSDSGTAAWTFYLDNVSIYTTTTYAAAINFTTPTPANMTTILSTANFTINALYYTNQILGANANITINVYNSTGANVRAASSLQSTNYSNTFSPLSSGTYYYNVTAENATHYGISTTRTLLISSITQNGINTPGQEQQISTTHFNITWNASTTDPAVSNLTRYNVTLLNRDGTLNRTISSNTGLNTSYFWNVTAENLQTATFYVRVYTYDTSGSYAYQDQLFHYIKPVPVFTDPALETAGYIFSINISLSALNLTVSTFNATILYNGTIYNTTSTIYSTSLYSYVNITIPNVTSNTIRNFTWNYSINSVTHYANYSHNVTLVAPVTVTNGACTGLSTAMFFTMKDEENQTNMNGTIEYNLYVGINEDFDHVYGSFSSTQNLSVCVNSTIYPEWTVDSGELHYTSTSYSDRRYYIFQNTRLSSTQTNITLYNLLTSSQTSFDLNVESNSFLTYGDKYTTLVRWYPADDAYRVVDMGHTDSTGGTVIHVVEEDVDYRIGVYELDGTLIYLADPIRLTCLTTPQCQYTLKVPDTTGGFETFLNIQSLLTYNETTGTFRVIFNDPSQTTSAINLTVYKITGTSFLQVCNSQISGYTGSLTCNVSQYDGTLKAVVSRSASPEVPISEMIINLYNTALKSSFGLWFIFILAIPIIFVLALMSPVLGIIGGILSMIPAWYLGIISAPVVLGLAVFGGIVVHMMRRS